MSKFSKNGNLMVYSNDVCGEEGGAEEFLAAVVIPEGPDRGKMEEPIPVPLHLTSSAKKDFDSDDVGLKLSDLPDDYFDDLLDLDLDEPAKKPEVCQLVQLENGKPDYDSECSEPEEVKPDASAEENFLPIITTKPIEGLVEFENSDAPCDITSGNKVVGQREKLKITFNKKFVKTKYTRVSRLNLLKSLFGDDEDDDMALPITIEKNAIELMCKRNKICENRKDTEHEEMKMVKVDEEKTEPLCSETCMKKYPTYSPIKKETKTSTLKCSNDETSYEEVKKYSYENIPSKQDSPKEEQRKQKSLSPPPQKPDEIKEQEWSSSRKRKSSSPASRSISKKKKVKKEKSKSKKTKKKSRKDRSTSPISPISKPESVKPSEAKIDDSTKMSSWKDSVEKFLQQPGQSKHIKTSPALPAPSPPIWNNLMPPQNYNMIRAMNCPPYPQMVNLAAGYMPSANFHWQGYPPPHFMFGQGPGYRPVIFSNGLPVPTDVSSQNLQRSLAPIQVKEPATNSPPVAKSMMSGIGVGSSLEMKECNLNDSDFPATLPSLLLAEGKNATTLDGKVTAEQNSEQVENSTAKKFTEASTSTDFLLPLTSGNQQTSNQDMIPEKVHRSKTHPLCSSKSVQFNSLCQDCSDKTQIIANIRKFAERMLAKNVHNEAMTVLLQMIEPGTQNSDPDGFQSADIDDIVNKIRSKEIFKTITYRKWHANIYNCYRKPLAEATNPSFDSKSTPVNQEATFTDAAVNQKCSGDLGKSPVKDNSMQIVPRKNRRPRKRLKKASCETQPLLANEGETLTKSTDSASSHLPSYADAIVQFTLLNHTKVDATQKSGTEKEEEKCKQQVDKQPEVQSTSPGIEVEVRESADKTLQRKPGSGERPYTANRTANYPRPEPRHAQHLKMRSSPTRARQVRMRGRNFSDNIPHNDDQWRMRRIPYYVSPPSDFRECRPEFRSPEEEFHFNERLRFNDCQPYYRDDYSPPRYSDGW